MAKRNGWSLARFDLDNSTIVDKHVDESAINILGEQKIIVAEEHSDKSTVGERIQPVAGVLVDHSGTITTANLSQLVMKENPRRRYLVLQNVSGGPLWFNFTLGAQTQQPSMQLASGAAYVMENSFVSTEALYIAGAVAGAAFVAKEG